MHDVTSTTRKVAAGFARVLSSRNLQGGLLALLVAAAAGPLTPQTARADTWWDGIQGFGTPDFSGKRTTERTPLKPDVVNDLRPGAIPFRSDEMVAFIDKAIVQYQAIVNKGGWPKIPGNRMIRPATTTSGCRSCAAVCASRAN